MFSKSDLFFRITGGMLCFHWVSRKNIMLEKSTPHFTPLVNI